MNKIVIKCSVFTVVIETGSEIFERGRIAGALCGAAGEAFSGAAEIAIERRDDTDAPFPPGAGCGGEDDSSFDDCGDGWELPGGELEEEDLRPLTAMAEGDRYGGS